LVGELDVDAVRDGIGHGVGLVGFGEWEGGESLEVLAYLCAGALVGVGQGSEGSWRGRELPDEVGENRDHEEPEGKEREFGRKREAKHQYLVFIF
jgi:hypothetical protein